MAKRMISVPLTKGLFALVDDEDEALICSRQWRAHRPKNSTSWYAYGATGNDTLLSMHRLIIGARSTQQVDHINGNGLDNRRSNLRICTPSQNQANKKSKVGSSSQYKGVCWAKDTALWQASIKKDGKNIYLGQFAEETEAAKAYDAAAKRLFGEFAYINFT